MHGNYICLTQNPERPNMLPRRYIWSTDSFSHFINKLAVFNIAKGTIWQKHNAVKRKCKMPVGHLEFSEDYICAKVEMEKKNKKQIPQEITTTPRSIGARIIHQIFMSAFCPQHLKLDMNWRNNAAKYFLLCAGHCLHAFGNLFCDL